MQGYQEIGALLEGAREERRLTIESVASVLHIRPRYLQGLEQGNFENMPGLTYVKGYLNRYASYLALDCDEISRRFDQIAERGDAASFFMPHTFSLSKRVERRTAGLWTLVTFFVLVIWLIWIRPEQTSPSLVDVVPEKPKKPILTAEMLEKAPCLHSEKGLYPPCYWPAPEPEKSLMQLLTP